MACPSCSHGYHILYKECVSKYNIWFLFFLRLFSPFGLWGKLWGNCGGKRRSFIGYNQFFALPARDTLASSPYSLCLRRKTLRLCQTNAPPKASPLRGCSQPLYIAYKKEGKISFCSGLRVCYLSVCNRYGCFWERGSASGYCVLSLRRW